MKYNWEAAKQDYIVGDEPIIMEYFRKNYGKYAPSEGTIRQRVQGWEEERSKYQTALHKRMNEVMAEKRTEMNLRHLEKMLKTKDKLIDLVNEYFSEGNAYEYINYTDPKTGEVKRKIKLLISSSEFKNMWQIIKAEVGEPTNIPAEPKETKAKLAIPESGVFGIKQLMVKWEQKNGKVKKLKGEAIEGEIVEGKEEETAEEDSNIKENDGATRTETNAG